MTNVHMVTGHRPPKIGGYGNWHGQTKQLKTQPIYDHMLKVLSAANPTIAISGMALGIDMLWAHAILDLGIPLHAYCPTPTQYAKWPHPSKVEWHSLIERAQQIHYTQETYTSGVEDRRNKAMVAASNHCHAYLLEGTTSGGTWNCVQDANLATHCTLHIYNLQNKE